MYLPVDIYTSDKFPESNDFMMVVHQTKLPLAKEIVRGFRPFLSRYGRIIAFGDNRTILYHDKGASISKLVEFSKIIDNNSSYEEIIRNKKENAKKSKGKRKNKKEKDRFAYLMSEVKRLEKENNILKKANKSK